MIKVKHENKSGNKIMKNENIKINGNLYGRTTKDEED